MFLAFHLIHRMIFWELLKVFLLSLVGLTGLFLIAGLVQQASQMGLSPNQVIQVIPLLIPSTLPYTIPATTLFASCVVYGRVSNDNEAVAIKAAGVDLLTVLRPAILLGLLTSCLTASLYYSVIPRTQQMLQAQLLQDPEEILYNVLKRERRFTSPESLYTVYVRDVQGRRLIDVVIKRKSAVKVDDGLGIRVEYDYVARAREARLIVDLEGRVLIIDADRWVVSGKGGYIDTHGPRPESIALPDMFSNSKIKAKPTSLEYDELPGRIRDLQIELQERKNTLNDNRKRMEDPATSPDIRNGLALQDPLYANQVKESQRKIRTVEYEFYIRPALAFSCLCFAVIGCPVGIWANRSDYLSTFVTCFLPAVFVYYPVLLSGGGLAKDGKVPMFLGVWAADLVIGLGAVFLIFRLIKR